MEQFTQSKSDAPSQNKEHNIIVNGRPKVFQGREISYNEVIILAYGSAPAYQTKAYSVTYKRGEGNKPECSMDEGDVVKVKEGMIFNATATDKS